MKEIYDCVSAHVSFSYCVTQNQHIVQIYYHSHIDLSQKRETPLVLGLIRDTGTWTPRESPSTETLRTSSSFDLMGNWSMHSSGPVCTSNLLPVLCALTEKSLPFWNGEKEWTGSTFLDLSQGNSPRLFSSQGISCSKTPLEQVEFSLLSLSSTSPLIPNPQELLALNKSNLLLVHLCKIWNFSLKKNLDEWYFVTLYHWQNILV